MTSARLPSLARTTLPLDACGGERENYDCCGSMPSGGMPSIGKLNGN